MNLNNIITEIASSFGDHTAAWDLMEENISQEIKKKFNIPENAKAISRGMRSAVFENASGNIVAFLPPIASSACEQAYKSVGRYSEILPEIYNFEYIETTIMGIPATICVIEMEKLKPTTKIEWGAINNILLVYRKGFTLKTIEQLKSNNSSDRIYDAVINLMERMIKENIGHTDLHAGNIAWSKDKSHLKLIDWESVSWL